MESVLLSFTVALVIFTAWQMVLRRRAERSFRIAADQAHFRDRKVQTILDNAPIVFSAVDTEGIFQISEGKGLAKLGRKSNESIGKSIYEMHNQSPIILNAVKKALAGEQTATSFVLQGIHYELFMGPEKNQEGKIIGATMLSVDITDQKKIEEEKAQMKIRERTAIETTKLKSEFLATMSHEIRTPLNGVIGMTSLLLETQLTHEQKDYAVAIRDSGAGLMTVINDILDFSKIEAGKIDIETIDFNLLDLISHALNGLRYAAAPKFLELINETSKAAPTWLKGDPGRIRQVLNNLVSNAIKFTERGQIIVRVLPGAQNHGVRIEVKDTGIGLSPEALSKMFIPFTQADASMSRRFGGTGLGLSISKQLTQKMGGQIGVESTEGQGSLFWFTLPLEAGAAPSEAISRVLIDDLATLAAQKSPRILIAEDNKVNQVITVRMLEKMGCQTQVAIDGYEALAALERSDFELVLMDCQMPTLDGLEATKKFRLLTSTRNKNIPILAMTANAMKGDKEKCFAAGLNDYISKPISYGDLSAVVARWLEFERKRKTS